MWGRGPKSILGLGPWAMSKEAQWFENRSTLRKE